MMTVTQAICEDFKHVFAILTSAKLRNIEDLVTGSASISVSS